MPPHDTSVSRVKMTIRMSYTNQEHDIRISRVNDSSTHYFDESIFNYHTVKRIVSHITYFSDEISYMENLIFKFDRLRTFLSIISKTISQSSANKQRSAGNQRPTHAYIHTYIKVHMYINA